MKNSEIKIQKKTDKQLRKIRDIYVEIIQKLFIRSQEGKQISIYDRKIEKVAKKKFNMRGKNFVHATLNELKTYFKHIQLGPKGRILNAKQIGEHFNALFRITSNNVDLFVIPDETHLNSSRVPLSSSFRDEFRKIIDRDEAAAILLVKHPPEETAHEIHEVTEQCLHGVMSLWANEQFQQTADLHENLRDYLQHATVRVLNTGYNPEVDKITKAINDHLERHGGFEDTHWIRVVKGVAQDEKKESLKQTLGVCIPIVVVVKIIERVVPGILHAIGGMLDDLFGAIIPDVSQSMGDRKLPMKKRFKNAWPVLKGGLVTLPFAFGLGWFSAVLHGISEATVIHMLSGVIFALACCLGTLGTSIAAFKKAYSSIGKLQNDKTYGYLAADLNVFEKINLAFKESIMDVPFRVGHTVIGVPFQIALGIAAGAFGFFHNTIFIMIEGMAETLLGAATTFAYPRIARFMRNLRLRRTEFDNK